MTLPPDDWPRLKEVFAGARALPANRRAAYLAESCGANETLRHEVESLLASETHAKNFLETPAVLLADATATRPEGLRVGPYHITSRIGVGEMGEVYRARDATLGRDVAIKMLPRIFANDPDRLARFDREARMLASLNHPHIGAIYGVEQSEGVPALILELVEGPTLADRLAQGPMPLAESLGIARQVVNALDAAHQRGIVHRDLKPANIKITPDGIVKVLDFGLAKAVASHGAARDLPESPTATAEGTQDGAILGTPSYMSPEQARGLPVDKRADIWAFGCLLYDMLTGRPAFPGRTVSDTIGAILEREPDWLALPADSPPLIRRLLRRCLEKDRTRRSADIADVGLDIDDALNDPHAHAPVAASASRTPERLAWVSGLVLVGLTAGALAPWVTRSMPVPPDTTRTLLSLPPMDQGSVANPLEQRVGRTRPSRTAVALSPDGSTLVFGAIWGGKEQLYARAMDQLNATPMAGTSGGSSPFMSPDGQWVGFWSGGELRKVPVGGGPSVTLCKAAAIFGASWGSDGAIVFATARNGGLWRVSAAGGTPEALTTLQPGEYSHRLPHVLPGADAVIFTISMAANRWDNTRIVVRSLATGRQTVLIEGGADGRYVSTGHLVYARLGALMAIPFDSRRLAVTGDARGLVDGVMQAANRNLSDMDNTLAAQFTVSDTGALVYVTGGAVPAVERSLLWVDRNGTSQALAAPPRSYSNPRLSPDGQRVAVHTLEEDREVWSYDVARGALSPITDDGQSGYGIFSPDGKRVVFRSGAAGGEDNLYWKSADGGGAAERLTTSARSQTPASWTPDGTALAFVEEGHTLAQQFFQFDIWVLSIADRKARAVVQTAANEMSPEFSPDGRWLAYVSNQSGRSEVYVQPYPGPGERHLISTNGGQQPAWASNRELVYVEAKASATRQLMSVRIETVPIFLAGTPETIFDNGGLRSNWGRSYDVTPDGRRFLITLDKEPSTNPVPIQMILVQNWLEELKRLVPTK